MSKARRAAYRIGQFLQMMAARPLSSTAWEEVSVHLNSGQKELFRFQSFSGQRHGYRVMATLRNAGHDDRELVAAALLHDIGKTRVRSSWWDKPVVVLVDALFPKLAEKWSQGEPLGWNRPFVVKKHHAEWGAAQAALAGSSALTVALIRRHQDLPLMLDSDTKEHQLLGLLQRADEQN